MTESTDKPLPDEAPPDEQQLDEYLKGDSSVSRQYRQLHSAEVPADLDRLVLRQAEDAVKSRPSRVRPAWVRWTAPLAVAASAVLVVSIVIETGVRDETVALQAPQPTMQAKERTESKAEGTTVDKRTVHAPGFLPPAEVAPEQSIEEQPAPRLRRAPVAPSQDVIPVAPPPPLEMDMPSSQAMAEPMTEAPKAFADDAYETPEIAVQNRPAPPPVAAPAVRPTIRPTRSISSSAEDAARVLRASSLEESTRKESADAADEAQREEERSAAAQMAYSRQISSPTPLKNYTDPEVWLKDIRQLRKDNKQEEADHEWRRFLSAFPNYEVAETDAAREAKK